MTLVMWVVLAGTVGLAALITRKPTISLTRPIKIGEIRAPVPVGWETHMTQGIFGQWFGTPELRAVGNSRTLTITVLDGAGMSLRSVLDDSLRAGGVLEASVQRIRLGNYDGLIASGDRVERASDADTARMVCAAARLPRGGVLRIELRSPERSANDLALVKRIAANVEFVGSSTSKPSGNEET